MTPMTPKTPENSGLLRNEWNLFDSISEAKGELELKQCGMSFWLHFSSRDWSTFANAQIQIHKYNGMSLCLHFSSSIQRLKYILVALNQKFNQRKLSVVKRQRKRLHGWFLLHWLRILEFVSWLSLNLKILLVREVWVGKSLVRFPDCHECLRLG